ncbi:MAG TPA: GH25 family lysozyme [Chitinophagaceae bacterium]|nr:GH25 family lysozyme [Chitinophagaceae bacterium]
MPPRKRKRRRKGDWLVGALILALCLTALGFFGFWWWMNRRARMVRYPEFGISIPESYPIHGIDVSKYQQVIAWEEVHAMQVRRVRLGFVFIKATEGIGNIDPQFRRNWNRSRQAGMVRGAYHFFLATKDGRLQAENFIRNVKLEAGDLPPVLDIEQTYGVPAATLQKEAREWLDIVATYYGVTPIIYTNVDFYKRNLGRAFDDYPLWVAHYYQPDQPRISRDWVFWQHSEAGRVNGILSPVDFNVFAGDSLAFKNLLVQ